jgi:hypothetical protein
MRGLVSACLLLAFSASGCADDRPVLDGGVQLGVSREVHRIGPAEALTAARRARADWKVELRRRAREDPRKRFPNPSSAVLRSRLEQAGERYGFEIVSLRLLRPRQLAPLVVVRTTHYAELARATRAILRGIDPKASTGDDRTGWGYEGFYFEARDERGIPFLLTFNFWRGTSGGGGQWARSQALFPFLHG